jgi:hypothetical protein
MQVEDRLWRLATVRNRLLLRGIPLDPATWDVYDLGEVSSPILSGKSTDNEVVVVNGLHGSSVSSLSRTSSIA